MLLYVVFLHQNRIEKYSPNGKLLFRADRHLDYDLKHEVVKEKHTSRSLGISKVMDVVKMTLVSAYIGIDGTKKGYAILCAYFLSQFSLTIHEENCHTNLRTLFSLFVGAIAHEKFIKIKILIVQKMY